MDKVLNPDGKFGTDTWLAVGLFQEMHGLTRDHIAGAETITELLVTVWLIYPPITPGAFVLQNSSMNRLLKPEEV